MSSGQGEIPDRQYSLRSGKQMMRCDSVTDGYYKSMRGSSGGGFPAIVRIKEDGIQKRSIIIPGQLQ